MAYTKDDTLPKLMLIRFENVISDGKIGFGALQGPSGGSVEVNINAKDFQAIQKLKDAGTKIIVYTDAKSDTTEFESIKVALERLDVHKGTWQTDNIGRSYYDPCILHIDDGKLISYMSETGNLVNVMERLKLTWEDVGVIGANDSDNIFLEKCSDAFCPLDASKKVKQTNNITVLGVSGGAGVLREVVDEVYCL